MLEATLLCHSVKFVTYPYSNFRLGCFWKDSADDRFVSPNNGLTCHFVNFIGNREILEAFLKWKYFNTTINTTRLTSSSKMSLILQIRLQLLVLLRLLLSLLNLLTLKLTIFKLFMELWLRISFSYAVNRLVGIECLFLLRHLKFGILSSMYQCKSQTVSKTKVESE